MPGSNSAWGLDVGTTALKAVKLRRDGDKVAIEAFDVVEHSKFLTEPDINRDEIIRQTLAKFLERNPTGRSSVFIGVPGNATFAKFVKLPPVEPKKIPEIVRFEAIQQIPFPLEQVNWDYQTFTSTDAPDVEVGIFAMKKDLVAAVLSNFNGGKMRIEGVQMAPLAVYNAVTFDGLTGGKGTVVLDIGAEHTDLIVADQGKLWLRTLNIGGNNFTDALAKSFKQSFNRAEQLKKQAATSKYARQIFQAMRPIFEDLVAEVQRSIGFYNSSHRDSKLERVVGMGNPFRLPNLQKYLQQKLSMEVVRPQEFQNAHAEGKLAAGITEHILALPAAYGLALQALDKAAIDVNLLPMDIARSMIWRQKNPYWVAAASLMLVAVGAGAYNVYAGQHAFAQHSDPNISQDAAKNDQAIGVAGGYQRKYQQITGTYDTDLQAMKNVTDLGDYQILWPQITNDVFAALPQKESEDPKFGEQDRSKRKVVNIRTLNAVYVPPAAQAAAGGGMPAGMPVPGMIPGAGMGGPAGTAASPVGRHYEVTIVGSIPSADWVRLLAGTVSSLKNAAPKDGGTKSYYYDFPPNPFSAHRLSDGSAPGATSTSQWGGTLGPYPTLLKDMLPGYDAATLDKQNPQAPQPAPGGMFGAPGAFGGRQDLTGRFTGGGTTVKLPLDPATGEDMSGDYIFTMTFNVVFKDTTAAAPAAIGGRP